MLMQMLLLLCTLTSAMAFARCVQHSLFAQSKTSARPQKLNVRVPFVGCESDGQVGTLKAPSRESKVVPITIDVASRLAFYKSEQGVGVLAPRGWYCFATYGSNGTALYVSPQPIGAADLFSTNGSGFIGPVVEIAYENGDTSGRFGVARTIARVFPAYKAFVDKVVEEGIQPASSFAFGPYPKDKLIYKDRDTVEYQTPAQTEGLGTNSRLKKNDTPISGVAILTGQTPDLVFLAVRLSADQTDLTAAIVRGVETDGVHSSP
jgi:hypothetical protein